MSRNALRKSTYTLKRRGDTAIVEGVHQVLTDEVMVGFVVPEVITREWVAKAAATLAAAILATREKEHLASYTKALYALQLALAAIGGKQGGRPPKTVEARNAKRKR